MRIRLLGPISDYTGYGVCFLELVRRLSARNDIDIDLRAVANSVPDYIGPDIRAILERNREEPDIGILVGFPTRIGELGTRYKCVYTMYETDDLPERWQETVMIANEIWVPNKFNGDVFSKYNRRIRVIPWGVNEKVFRTQSRQTRQEYRFGAVGVQSKRKGVDVLVKAFDIAFQGKPGVSLTIKTRDTRWMPKISNPMIDVIDEDWPEERLVQFYNEIDCLVEASRGEGHAMPPLQAALCGTPSLVTNWGGPTDYIDNNGIWGIRTSGLVDAENMEVRHAHWAEPDLRHLVYLMRWAADTKPRVHGDYSNWTMANMTEEFVAACRKAVAYGSQRF